MHSLYSRDSTGSHCMISCRFQKFLLKNHGEQGFKPRVKRRQKAQELPSAPTVGAATDDTWGGKLPRPRLNQLSRLTATFETQVQDWRQPYPAEDFVPCECSQTSHRFGGGTGPLWRTCPGRSNATSFWSYSWDSYWRNISACDWRWNWCCRHIQSKCKSLEGGTVGQHCPLFWHFIGSSKWSPESFDWWWWHHRLSNRGTPFRWDPRTCKNKVGCVISEGYQTAPLPTIQTSLGAHFVINETLGHLDAFSGWLAVAISCSVSGAWCSSHGCMPLLLLGLLVVVVKPLEWATFSCGWTLFSCILFWRLATWTICGWIQVSRDCARYFSDYVILWARSQLTQTRSRHELSWRFVLFWRKGCRHFCDCIQTLSLLFLMRWVKSTGEIFGH